MMPDHHIRISEWATVSVDGVLSAAQREAVAAAADGWRDANAMNVSPLSFSGPRGDQLCACQFVGVVEVGDTSIEIYPKLDGHLLQSDLIASDQLANSVMRNLMWMLEVSGYMDISEIDTAHLQEHPVSFYDVFAYLMAKNLLDELGTGVPHAYVTTQDSVRAVKGRINIREQVTSHWNRLDRIACIWDEFTPDIPLNRLFKCACRVLNGRVANPVVSRMLVDCLMYLDQVADVAPEAALRAVEFFRWDRSNERLKMCFNMAVRLLAGTGYSMDRGEADTFVFLMNMNQLFEDYAARIVEAHFSVPVQTQQFIGRLFKAPQRLSQYPDFLWNTVGRHWIGDAKYKHLAKGQQDALVFADLESEVPGDDTTNIRADRALNTSDVRQLIVYAELLRLREGLQSPPAIAILYPFIGTGKFSASRATAFNGSEFWMIPVWVKRMPSPSNGIPLLWVPKSGVPRVVGQTSRKKPQGGSHVVNEARLEFWRGFCEMAAKRAPDIVKVTPTDGAKLELASDDDDFSIVSRADRNGAKLSVVLGLHGNAAAEQWAKVKQHLTKPDSSLGQGWSCGHGKGGGGFLLIAEHTLDLDSQETWLDQHQWILGAVQDVHDVLLPLIKKMPAGE